MPDAMLTVRDLMSLRLLVVQQTASVGRTQAEMKLAHIRHFPVVNRKNELVGVVSQRDLFRALGPGTKGKSLAISQIMTTDIQTVRADQPAHEAARLMRKLKVGMLPVVGREETLIGIITETDFLAAAETLLAGRKLLPKGR